MTIICKIYKNRIQVISDDLLMVNEKLAPLRVSQAFQKTYWTRVDIFVKKLWTTK